MTEAMVDDALVEKVAREAYSADTHPLAQDWEQEDPITQRRYRCIAVRTIAIAYPAGVAAGREEAAVVPDRVRGAATAIEATVHKINGHWWNRRIRPDARDLRIVLDFVAATAIRQRGE